MKSNDPGGSGPLVQAIDVLGDQVEFPKPATPTREDLMCAIGVAGRNQLPTPLVPFPDQLRVSVESLRCSQVLRTMGPPQSIFTAKRGNATGRGNAGARDHRHSLCPTEPGSNFFNYFLINHAGDCTLATARLCGWIPGLHVHTDSEGSRVGGE